MINLQGFGKSKTVTKRRTLVCRKLFKRWNSTGKNKRRLCPGKPIITLSGQFFISQELISIFSQPFKKDPVVLKTYDNIKKSEEAKGIIEEALTILKPPGEIHYLHHHPVIRPEKSATKLRIVYDVSSSIEGPSLNQCLETGPNLLPKLTDILIRFRSYQVALISDIKQAFLNVSVKV